MAAEPVILWDGLLANQATLQVFIFSRERRCGIQNHLLGWVLFIATRKQKSTPHWFEAFEMSFSVTCIWWSVLSCLRHGWLMELEIQRVGGYHSALLHVISAGKTDLTQLKRVTWNGYGNKTRKTDRKANPPTTTNLPKHHGHTVLMCCEKGTQDAILDSLCL